MGQLQIFGVAEQLAVFAALDEETGFPVGADMPSVDALASGVGTTMCEWCGFEVVHPKFCGAYFDYTKQPDAEYPAGSSHRAVYRGRKGQPKSFVKVSRRLPPEYPGDIRCQIDTELVYFENQHREWVGTDDPSGIELWPHEYSCSRPEKWAEYKAERAAKRKRYSTEYYQDARERYTSCGICHENRCRDTCIGAVGSQALVPFLGGTKAAKRLPRIGDRLLLKNSKGVFRFGSCAYEGILFICNGRRGVRRRTIAIAWVVGTNIGTPTFEIKSILKLPHSVRTNPEIRAYAKRMAEAEFDAANEDYRQKLEAA